MPSETPRTPVEVGREFETLLSAGEPLVAQLYVRAAAERWSLAPECFARTLRRSAASRFRSGLPSPKDLARYLESLHLEDLGLACACSEGAEAAWEFFMAQYREDLYRAARAMVGSRGGEARARELADSLYADLYGLSESSAGRRSLFNYFHGRSRLSTWLRAVLAQRHVDTIRAARRTDSLDETTDGHGPRELPADRGTNSPEPLDPDRARYLALLEAALHDSLAALEPRDRLRLAYYYVHERTLAEIGRILGEHEATVSRHLDRIRGSLRENTVNRLRSGSAAHDGAAARGLSEAQIDLCFAYVLGDWPFDLTQTLDIPSGGGSPPEESSRKPRGKA
jgi:RNA polymerase sigma-70 factor (ECF subfamily)